MKSLTLKGIVLAAMLIPLISFAQSTGGIRGVGQTLIGLINSVLVPLLLAIAFIVFIYGIAKSYIFSQGDEGAVEQGHKIILWGLIGFFVILSVWGLVNILVDTFRLNSIPAPNPPTFGPLR